MQSKAPDVGEVPILELLAEGLRVIRPTAGSKCSISRSCGLREGRCRGRGGRVLGASEGRGGCAAQFTAAAERAGLSAVRDVCERIGRTVIAQGIATMEQAAALRGMMCKVGQGELYGPALRLQRMGKAGKAKVAR
jgi:hypothetical protein